MITGRRTTDWLSGPKDVSNEDERRGDDRRALDRRAPKRRFDPLFTATLVSQLKPANDNAPPRATYARAYQSPLGRPYCGALLNVKT